MAVPKNVNKYSAYKHRKNLRDSIEIQKCKKQFPDCPLEINEKDCKNCPLYKK